MHHAQLLVLHYNEVPTLHCVHIVIQLHDCYYESIPNYYYACVFSQMLTVAPSIYYSSSYSADVFNRGGGS